MRDRLRQFREAGREPSSEDFELGRQRLTPELFALFCAQHPRDVVHSAATARWLLNRGHGDVDLITAALLHDIGKGKQRRTDRAAYVIAARFHLASRVASAGAPTEVQRAMARTLDHSRVGAEALAAHGASERTVNLTLLHHSSPATDPVLALLQQADAAN